MTLTNRRALPLAGARALWARAREDERARAPVAMMLLAGLRPPEVCEARWDGHLLYAAGRRIPVGLRCAAALNAVPRRRGPLLPQLTVVPLVQLVRAVARQAGLDAGSPDLRHAAIRAAFEAGMPPAWICAYFGTSPGREPLTDGWDDAVASVLEDAFT